jgi:arsenate reductase
MRAQKSGNTMSLPLHKEKVFCLRWKSLPGQACVAALLPTPPKPQGRPTMIRLYHNPRCSKSREALALLQEAGAEVEVIEYLKHPPTAAELDHILTLLQLEPRDLLRTKEEEYETLCLDDITLERDSLIETMVDNPMLIERPIAVSETWPCWPPAGKGTGPAATLTPPAPAARLLRTPPCARPLPGVVMSARQCGRNYFRYK